MTTKSEAAITSAVADGTQLGVAAIAVDKNGKIIYSKAFGHNDVETKQGDLTIDSVQWIASMTKLISAISALQLVEKGLLKLDEPISEVLDEFKKSSILTAYDAATNTPTIEPASRAPTLREMLTHSSGLAYIGLHPTLTSYWTTYLSHPPQTTKHSIRANHDHPLVFSPGTSWSYSCGLNYTGLAIARVSGSASLGEYMEANIFEPLGMKCTTFHPVTRIDGGDEDFSARMTTKPMRDPQSGKLVKDITGLYPMRPDPEDEFGGAGLYSSANDYSKVLASLLANDGKLLKRETVTDVLFKPSLSPEAKKALNATLSKESPLATFLAPSYPSSGEPAGRDGEGVEFDYSPAGAVIVNKGGVKGLCEEGMVYWAGLSNCHWLIDQYRGVAGVYASHLLPPGDAQTSDLYRMWHEEVFEMGRQ